MRKRYRVLAAVAAGGLALLASGCASSGAATSGDAIVAVGAENEYANASSRSAGSTSRPARS
jgi:ABC-type oligopeptide transport system substrate-binding subunit